MKDPKKEAGSKKDQLQLIPTVFMRETAKALHTGAVKYGNYNWRENGVDTMTYVGAIMRHLCQFVDGEDQDGESGLSHIAHIAATCAVLLDADKNGVLLDDRPKQLLK